MAVTENTTGSTTTDGTEQTLATINTAGNYQLVLNFDAAVNNDLFEVRVKRKARVADGAAATIYCRTFGHDMGEEAVVETPWIAIPTNGNLVFTLKRVQGTDRAITWAILTQ